MFLISFLYLLLQKEMPYQLEAAILWNEAEWLFIFDNRDAVLFWPRAIDAPAGFELITAGGNLCP